MTESRDDRRKRLKVEERKRQEEVDALLDEPQLPAFEAPATGKIVDSSVPPTPPRPRIPPGADTGGEGENED